MKNRVVFRCTNDMCNSLEQCAKIYETNKSEVIRRAINKLLLDVAIDRGEIEYEVDTDGETTYYHAE